MKKLITLLLTAALAITAATTAFAADTTVVPGTNGSPSPETSTTNVTYTVNPSYTVTIPENVVLDSTTKSGTATVKAENVTVAYGQSVKVALATDFTVNTAEGAALKYKVLTGNGVFPVRNGDPVLTVPSGRGESTLTFKLDDNAEVVYSGTYTDRVTFTVSVS